MKKWMTLLLALPLMSSCMLKAQNQGSEDFKTVDNDEFESLIADVNHVQLVDVRTQSEYAEGHLNGALLMDVKSDSFLTVASVLPKSRTVAVYCRSGRRSARAAGLLADAGYKVVNLRDGIMGWQKAGKNVVRQDTPRPDSTGYIVYEGMACPDFTVTLTNGKKVHMSDLKGKVVMLQFTANWCGVCRKEMPHIEKEIWQRHKSDPDFVLVGIDRDEPLEKVLKFAKSTGVTYPLALDPGAKVFSLFAQPEAGITRNVLVNREGVIIHRTRLYNESEFAELVKHIDKELQQ